MPIRYCAYQSQNLPLRELEGRWRRAEELRFDVLWIVDTVVDPDLPRSTMFDGPATLTVMAVTTGGILERVCADVIPGLRETTT